MNYETCTHHVLVLFMFSFHYLSLPHTTFDDMSNRNAREMPGVCLDIVPIQMLLPWQLHISGPLEGSLVVGSVSPWEVPL